MSAALTFRLAAVGFAVLAIATAAWSARHPAPMDPAPIPMASAPSRDPARADLERCQLLGQAGANDPACLKTWADQRRRFLGVQQRAR